MDDSGSMETSQSALGQAATAVASRLGNSQLDWRIGMVRVNGFDVDGVSRVLSSTKAAISYRPWSDLTPSWAPEP